MASKKKSEVWLHFSEEKYQKVRCLVCGQQLSVSNKSTCGLIRHLRRKHPAQKMTRQTSPIRMDDNNSNSNINSAIDEQTTFPNQPSTCFVHEDHEPSDDTLDPLKVAKYSILTESDTENMYTTSPCYYETSKEIDDAQISDEFKEPIKNELKKKKNSRLNNKKKKEDLSNSSQELPNPKEDLEIIGKFIALQLKDLNTDQLTIVHKIISDAIFYAKMGRLTANSSINLDT